MKYWKILIALFGLALVALGQTPKTVTADKDTKRLLWPPEFWTIESTNIRSALTLRTNDLPMADLFDFFVGLNQLPFPLELGGTGATNAAGVRAVLSLADWTTNATAPTGSVSYPILLSQGGSGATDAPGARAAFLLGEQTTNTTAAGWRSALGLGEWTTNSSSPTGSVSYPIAITQGGTSATNAAGARSSLGIAEWTTNSTPPTGSVSFPITIAQGGHGGTTAAEARANLAVVGNSSGNATNLTIKGGSGVGGFSVLFATNNGLTIADTVGDAKYIVIDGRIAFNDNWPVITDMSYAAVSNTAPSAGAVLNTGTADYRYGVPTTFGKSLAGSAAAVNARSTLELGEQGTNTTAAGWRTALAVPAQTSGFATDLWVNLTLPLDSTLKTTLSLMGGNPVGFAEESRLGGFRSGGHNYPGITGTNDDSLLWPSTPPGPWIMTYGNAVAWGATNVFGLYGTPGTVGTNLLASSTASNALQSVLGVQIATKRPAASTNWVTPMPFHYPGTIAPTIIPVTTTTSWTAYNGSVAVITNGAYGDYKGWGQNGTMPAFLRLTKAGADVTSRAYYDVTGVITNTFADWTLLIGVRTPGTNTSTVPFSITALWMAGTSDYISTTVAVGASDMSNANAADHTVWNALPLRGYETATGTGKPEAVRYVGIEVRTLTNAEVPVTDILYMALVPSPDIPSQFVVITDVTSFANEGALNWANACAANGIFLTMGQGPLYYTAEQQLTLASMGHAVSVRGGNWSTYATPADLLAAVLPLREDIINNGSLMKPGYRWISVGNGGKIDDSWWTAMVPRYFDGIIDSGNGIQSPYFVQKIQRWHEFQSGSATNTFNALVDKVASSRGMRLAILCHGANSTNFINQAIPKVRPYLLSGQLASYTLPDCYQLWERMSQVRSVTDGYDYVTAAGSTISDATTLTFKPLQVVSGGDGAKGVILSSTTPYGTPVTVYNTAAANLKVYPHSGGYIADATATNTAVTLTNYQSATFTRAHRYAWSQK